MKQHRVLVSVTALFFLIASSASADTLDDLRQRLFEKRQAVQEIQDRIQKYQQDVSSKRQEATTLQGQIDVIDDGVRSLTLQIDKTKVEIEEIEAELAALKAETTLVETDLGRHKELLRAYLRELQAVDADSMVASFLKHATLSQGVTELRTLYRVEQNTQESLDKIQALRETLKERSEAFTDLQRELDGLLVRQTNQRQTLSDQQAAKERLLEITQSQEEEFKKLLSSSLEAQRRASAEISRIDAEIRAELEKQGIRRLGSVGRFDWPITPIFGVSCGFHCPDYPYRNLIGPHTGADIPTHMGTDIRAPADGYVARNSIAGGAGYSYILIIHGDQLSTVYGHVSRSAASEGSFVTRGQVIGYTGGAPGTQGSGLSTGPHLHFEVRKNGIPVDPLAYLP